jgi:3-oxoacyl-[acyl-carrier-protein] synthase II
MLPEFSSIEGPLMKALEPVYKDYLNPMMYRRLSRIIRIGLTSALVAWREAGESMPGAVITGTGLGCVEDTEKFLTTMLDHQETLMNPSNFIQSTYNTISSQIAILLKCPNYNSTYVHRALSFESAINDACDLILSGEADTALAGGIDEITLSHHEITSLRGYWKTGRQDSFCLKNATDPGTIAGEGSAFFILGKTRGSNCYGKLAGVEMMFAPGRDEMDAALSRLLASAGQSGENRLLLLGYNGDSNTDMHYDEFAKRMNNLPVAMFKHLCGEYYTASAFGTWLSLSMLKTGNVPEVLMKHGNPPGNPDSVLLYNRWSDEHSLMLFTR